MDKYDRETRSRMMSSVKCKNTGLENIVRKNLFRMGFRYRLNVNKLPGKPDLVLKKYGAAIFVHGCFWHQHGCSLSKLPATRESWWKEKLEGNKRRDKNNLNILLRMGWRVIIIWQCALYVSKIACERNQKVSDMIVGFLHSDTNYLEIQ